MAWSRALVLIVIASVAIAGFFAYYYGSQIPIISSPTEPPPLATSPTVSPTKTTTVSPPKSPAIVKLTIGTDKPSYVVGERVEIIVSNAGDRDLSFPNSAFGMQIFQEPGRKLVFSPAALQVITPLPPGQSKSYMWPQVDNEERQVLPGDYVVVVKTASVDGDSVVTAEARFEISAKSTATVTSPTPVQKSLRVEKVYDGLNFPVSVAFAPDGRVFFNERLTGNIRVIQNNAVLAQPFASLEVVTIGETGLLGLALDPDFVERPYVYVYYTYRAADGQVFNRVARFLDSNNQGTNFQVILDKIPAAGIHNGGRLAFGPDGKLYVSTGDSANRELSQDTGSLAGKILRINREGTIPEDNPLPGSPVFSYGHRNVFGLAFHPKTGKLFITENGPTTDDEVNLVEGGKNYGWPIVVGVASDPRFINPILTFTPNIAPTGIAFYTGDKLPSEFRDGLIFGDWNTGSLRFISLAQPNLDRVTSSKVVLKVEGGHVLEVANGPDGFLYVSTPDAILKVIAE